MKTNFFRLNLVKRYLNKNDSRVLLKKNQAILLSFFLNTVC